MSNKAILLIAHGSRRKEANQELVKLSELVKERMSDYIIKISYLELAEPSIPQGAEHCVEAGATEVVLLPYFLSMGMHVVEDLQEFRQQFIEKYPDVTFKVAPPLGLHPKMIEILIDRFHETV